MSSNTDSKVWFITGCSTGFGKSIALQALARGDRVIATARSAASLDDLAKAGAHTMQLDVTESTESIKEKAKIAENVYGRVDVVVNNAAYVGIGSVEEMGAEGMKKNYDVNFFGLLNVTNAFLSYMRARKSGTIVIVGSRSGWRSFPLAAAYSTSKAAVNALGEILSQEVAPFGIRVLTLVPGGYLTSGTTAYPSLSNPSTSHADYTEIPDYASQKEWLKKALTAMGGSQLGDPEKLVSVVLDVVRGEGVMKNEDGTLRPWPERLVMGSDAVRDIRSKLDSYDKHMNEWSDIISSTDMRKLE